MSTIHAITMPKWGIEMEEGMITDWLIEIGAEVAKGADLIDIETAKIVNTLESPWSGTLKRIIGNTGDTLPVGALLGIICETDVDDAEIDAFVAVFKPVDASFENADDKSNDDQSAAKPPAASSASKTSTAPASNGKVRVSPPVRRLAESLGVDLESVDSGGSRITKAMVEAAAAGTTAVTSSASADAPAYAETTVASMSNRRKTIANRLVEAKTTIPHYYLTADLVMDPLLAQKSSLSTSDRKCSLNDLLVYCLARALVETPAANVNVINDEIRTFKHANVAIAVATDDGLVAPVLHQADTLDIKSTAQGLTELVKRAQSNKLKAADFQHGSFSLSNLGMYGIDSFQAIVNPPQGAILAVGAAQEKVIVLNGKSKTRTVMTANLSCDHRVIDGAVGASLLANLKKHIETSKIT